MNQNTHKEQGRLKQYIKLWIILTAVYCVVTFIFVGSGDGHVYTTSFWIGFILTTVGLCVQLVCGCITTRDINFAKNYHEIYLSAVNYVAFIGTVVLGLLSMMMKFIPYWLGGAISWALIGVNIYFVKKAADLSEFKSFWNKTAIVRKVVLIAIPSICVIIGVVLFATRFLIPNGKYNDAKAMMNEGKYEESVELFTEISEFKDSSVQIENCYIEMYGADDYSEIRDAVVGGTYTIGNYNGDITWRILNKEGSKLLLISEECIENLPYNDEYIGVTWENSTIRSWLNGEFYDQAFSEEEKAIILTTNVQADINTVYPTKADAEQGNDTRDNVFLLSSVEAEEYFSSNADRIAYASDKVKDSEAIVSNDGATWWWLRTSGELQSFAAYVYGMGEIYYHGRQVSSMDLSVRPAIWVDLDS